MALTRVSTAMFNTAAQTSDLNIDANTLVVDVSTNRVGIGTTTPSVPLEVSGQLKAGGILFPTSDGSAGQALVTDGSGTASFATVAPTAGTGVTVSGTTVAIGQAVSTSSNVTFNDVVVAGTLTINGATNTNSATNTTIEDLLIELGTGTTGSPANDAGLVLERGSSANVFIGWDESSDTFTAGTGTFTGASSGNLSITPATAVFGGLIVDTSTLVVDASNNRVGIGNASPDVALDIGSLTDAVHMPVGTTAQRPTGAAGYLRYNSTLGKFEGYTTAWGEIGGGGANTFTTNVYTTSNASTTAFTLSQSVADVNDLIVFVDGVFQVPTAAYTVSGTTLTLTAAPASGRKVVAYSVNHMVSGSNLVQNSFTANGSTVAFTLSTAPVNENNTQVFLDGVYQHKATYATSGTTLTFDAAPASGVAIEVMVFTQTSINVPVDNTITTAKIVDANVTTAKIADANVTTAKIVDANVTTAKIADDAVTSAKLASGLTLGGTTVATNLDISGDVDIDGTTNLDVVDIDGAVDMASTLTVAGAVTGSSSFATAAGGTFTTASGNDLNIVYPDSRSLFFKEAGTTTLTLDNAQGATFAGNVGIGAARTDGTLHVQTGSAGTVAASTQADDIVIENNAEGGMTIITPDDQSARIRFTSPSTNNEVGGAHVFYRQNINKMQVGTAVSGGVLSLASGASNETMLLDGSGNVGIGNAGTFNGTGTRKVQIETAASSALGPELLIHNAGQGADAQAALTFGGKRSGNEGYTASIHTTNNDGLHFGTAAATDFSALPTTRMVIDAAGLVGIGNSIPSSFHAGANNLVVGSGSGSEGITIYGGAESNIFFADGTAGTAAYIGRIEYSHSVNNMLFYVNNANPMTINSDGKIDVGAVANQTKAVLNARFNGAAIEFGHGNNSAGYYGTAGSYGNNGHPYIGFSCDGEESVNTFTTRGAAGNIITGDLSGNLTFAQVTTASATGQTPVNRMTLDASGNLLLGHTGQLSASKFLVSFDGTSHNAYVARTTRTGINSNFAVFLNSSNQVAGAIIHNGSTTVNYSGSSDQRLKENIEDADASGSTIDAIQVRKFDWIDGGAHEKYGFIAQELNNVVPNAVSSMGMPDEEDPMLGVDPSKLMALAIKEIQMLRARVAQLENN